MKPSNDRTRVNITLDLQTGDAKKQKELPFKILVLGDFLSNQTVTNEKYSLSDKSFDDLMTRLKPQVNFQVDNHILEDGEPVDVTFTANKISDFSPQGIVDQIPELQKLIAMRNLLKELKNHMAEDKSLRKILVESLM